MRAIIGATANGRLIALADSDGSQLSSSGGLGMEEVLAWISGCSDGSLKPSSSVSWFSTAWLDALISGAPDDVRLDICASIETMHGAWGLLWIPGKFLEVRRLRKLWRIFEPSGMFPQRSLASILARWDIPVPPAVATYQQHELSGWSGHTLTSIAQSCSQIATAVCALMGRVQSGLEAIELSPARWHGVGALASKILGDMKAARWIAHYRPGRQPEVAGTELLPIFQSAYYGGRVETTVSGSWSVPTYRYDLRSAYAWALSWLGPLGFEWEERSAFTHEWADRMSVWYVSWEMAPGSPLGPFPYRYKFGAHGLPSIGCPLTGRGWYWWPEVSAAIRAYGESAIRVHGGYLSPRSSRRPMLPQIARRFAQRLQCEKEGDPTADLIKTGLAACYGRLAQRESSMGEPGRFYNPALAGWVTSAVRARLIDAWRGREASVCAVATDSLLTTERLPVAPSDALGGWKEEVWGDVSYVLPGVYRLRQQLPNHVREEVATAGISSLDFDWLLTELTASGRAAVTQPWHVPNLLSDLFPEIWGSRRCQWVEGPVSINPYRVGKKRANVAGLAGLDWRTEYHHMEPHVSLGEGVSAAAPGPPAWDGAVNPYSQALSFLRRGR